MLPRPLLDRLHGHAMCDIVRGHDVPCCSNPSCEHCLGYVSVQTRRLICLPHTLYFNEPSSGLAFNPASSSATVATFLCNLVSRTWSTVSASWRILIVSPAAYLRELVSHEPRVSLLFCGCTQSR